MNRTTSITFAALMVALAAGAASAPAYAQHQSTDFHHPGSDTHMRDGGPRGFWLHHDRGPSQMHMALRGGPGRDGRGGLLNLVCAPDGADRLEHLLLDVSQRVDPTTEQQALYDTFKTAALTAQTDFADACAEARPDRETAATLDLADRLKTRLAIEKAHLEAMTTVVPAFEAFYDSLTDTQKQSLEPRRGRHHHEGRMIEEPGLPGEPAPGMDQPPHDS